MVVADVVFSPPRTRLLREAEAQGCRVLDGLGMLVNQGVISVADNNLSMPAIAVPSGGHGVMGMSVMGDDFYPSAAWTTSSLSAIPCWTDMEVRSAEPASV